MPNSLHIYLKDAVAHAYVCPDDWTGESYIYQPNKNLLHARLCKRRASQPNQRGESCSEKLGDRRALAEFYFVFFGVGAYWACQ